jgi:hypothetical protein
MNRRVINWLKAGTRPPNPKETKDLNCIALSISIPKHVAVAMDGKNTLKLHNNDPGGRTNKTTLEYIMMIPKRRRIPKIWFPL